MSWTVRRSVWRETPELQASLETLARRGLSTAQIAKRLRMTPGAIRGRAGRTGVKLLGKPGRPRKQ